MYLIEAKVDDFAKRYLNYHKDHPVVQTNPEQAEKTVRHAHKFAQGHDEAIYLTKELLNGSYRPEEDDATIQSVLGKWRKAKTQGLVGGKLSDHTHESISAAFRDIPQLNMQKRQATALHGMEKYKIGAIQHPQHGNLSVYNIREKDVKDDKEYEDVSGTLRKTCSGSSWCVLPQQHGPTHLKHYSHGHGIFFYVNDSGQPVLSHGFGDRGIVRPDNSVIDEKEEEDIKKKTSSLLSGDKKEAYDFFTGKAKDMSPEKQMRMYDEFGKEHAVAHFLDPKLNTHPHLLTRIINDHAKHGANADQAIANALISHPNFSDEHIKHIFNSYEKTRNKVENIKKIQPNYETSGPSLENSRILDRLSYMGGRAAGSGKISKTTLSRALDMPNETIKVNAIRNYKMDDELYSKVFDDPMNYRVHREAAASGYDKMSPHVFQKAFDMGIHNGDSEVIRHLGKSKNLTPAHIQKLLDVTDTDKISKQLNREYASNPDPEVVKTKIRKAQNRANEFFYAVGGIVQNSKNTSSENLHAAISHPNLSMSHYALDSENITDEHLKTAMHIHAGTDIAKKAKAMHSSYDSSDLREKLNSQELNGRDQPMLKYYAKNKHLSDGDFDALIQHVTNTSPGSPSVGGGGRTLVGTELLKNPSIKSEHVAQLAAAPLSWYGTPKHVRHMALKHPKLTSEHIDRLIGNFEHLHQTTKDDSRLDELQSDMEKMASNPSLNSQHLSRIVKSNHMDDATKGLATDKIIKSNKITPENIDDILALPELKSPRDFYTGWIHKEPRPLTEVLFNHNAVLLPRHIEALKNHRNPGVRQFAEIRSPDLSSERMHHILANTNDESAVMTLMTHPNRKEEHRQSLLKNPNEQLRKVAQSLAPEEEKKTVQESLITSIAKVLMS